MAERYMQETYLLYLAILTLDYIIEIHNKLHYYALEVWAVLTLAGKKYCQMAHR